MLNFLKNFLFIDQRTKELSHTKFWSNVGYASMVFTFIYSVMFGTTVGMELWALFGVIVVGNRTINHMIKKDPPQQ